jgi:DNA-binding NtrC family response regulator
VNFSVLLVDDDVLFASTVQQFLARDGIRVEVAHSLSEARPKLGQQSPLVLLDTQLPDGLGSSLVPAIRSACEWARVIVVTGSPAIDNAIEALRMGIDDYLLKPVDLEALRLAVLRSRSALVDERVAAVERWRRTQLKTQSELISRGAWFSGQHQLLQRAAASTFPIVLRGETGCGKTQLARYIHSISPRAGGPFLSLNCASIPESLIESELFGHERGAFTGAAQAKEGLFELAEGGTLLLDEIGEMSLSAQSKLLTVLEDGLVRRVGGTSTKRCDVRIIAATHVDLRQATRQHAFRDDLRYRLEVVSLLVPPLRERLDELEQLIAHWLERLRPQRNYHVPDSEIQLLKQYAWPGNLRELRNVLERALLVADTPMLLPSRQLDMAPVPHQSLTLPPLTLAELEQRRIGEALQAAAGSRNETAAALGISLATLRRKLKFLPAAQAPSLKDQSALKRQNERSH